MKKILLLALMGLLILGSFTSCKKEKTKEQLSLSLKMAFGSPIKIQLILYLAMSFRTPSSWTFQKL